MNKVGSIRTFITVVVALFAFAGPFVGQHDAAAETRVVVFKSNASVRDKLKTEQFQCGMEEGTFSGGTYEDGSGWSQCEDAEGSWNCEFTSTEMMCSMYLVASDSPVVEIADDNLISDGFQIAEPAPTPTPGTKTKR
jgi:hypothetical protein